MRICYLNNNGGKNTENTVEALIKRLNGFGIKVVGEHESCKMNGESEIIQRM